MLFPSPSTPFSTPTGVLSVHRSIREQKEAAEKRKKEKEMAESVEALDQCCQATKAKVDRIKKAIVEANKDHTKFAHNALKLYLRQVDSAYEEYNNFQNRIYLTDPTKKAEFEQKFIVFEELYEFVQIALSEMIEKYEDAEKAVAEAAAFEREKQLLALKFQNTTVAVGGRSGNEGVQAAAVQPRMPPSLLLQQTPLPTFDGRYEHWHKFKARFSDIVDRCTQDSPATKLHYLDKALVGEAQGAIDEQTLNDNNYEGAWRILIERYENLPMVIHGHVTKLLNLKPMVRESSLELRALIDDCTKRVESLEFHKLKMDKMAEAVVITLLTSKLDPSTRRSWEASCEHGKLPVYEDTIAFLRKHSYVLERCEQNMASLKPKVVMPKTPTPTFTSKAHSVLMSTDGCWMCGSDHPIEECEAFKDLNVDERYTKTKQLGVCFGCLERGHRTTSCKKNPACPVCKKKHHALMHPEKPAEVEQPTTDPDTSITESLTAATCTIPIELAETKKVLLATAEVKAYDFGGEAHTCRVLLDSGAKVNFMTARMVEILQLPKEDSNVPVEGVNGAKIEVRHKVSCKVVSRTTRFESWLEYLVVPQVTGDLPAVQKNTENWHIPESVPLADPKFSEPGRIDMLVGAELFFEVLQQGKIKLAPNLPLLQESQFGWLISGPVVDTAVISTEKMVEAKIPDKNDRPLNGTTDEHGGDASLPSVEGCGTDGTAWLSRVPSMRRFVEMERALERCLENMLVERQQEQLKFRSTNSSVVYPIRTWKQSPMNFGGLRFALSGVTDSKELTPLRDSSSDLGVRHGRENQPDVVKIERPAAEAISKSAKTAMTTRSAVTRMKRIVCQNKFCEKRFDNSWEKGVIKGRCRNLNPIYFHGGVRLLQIGGQPRTRSLLNGSSKQREVVHRGKRRVVTNRSSCGVGQRLKALLVADLKVDGMAHGKSEEF